ncbi:peroxisomal membrane protein pex14 [Sorochytrium milnesiophthora]
MREDLIASAVRFLQDPKVQDATLAKKIAFLESKGLTSDEINAAVARTSGSSATTTTAVVAGGAPPVPPPSYHPQGQAVLPRAGWTWREYLIAVLAAGGAGFSAYTLAQKYLPSTSQLQHSEEAFQKLVDETKASIGAANTETAKLTEQSRAQLEELAQQLSALSKAIDEIKANESRRELEIKRISEDVESLKEKVPKVDPQLIILQGDVKMLTITKQLIEQSKSSQISLLNDLQTDVRSLKTFLGSSASSSNSGSIRGSSTATAPALHASSSNEQLSDSTSPQSDTPSQGDKHATVEPPIQLGAPKLPAWQRKSAPAAQVEVTDTDAAPSVADEPTAQVDEEANADKATESLSPVTSPPKPSNNAAGGKKKKKKGSQRNQDQSDQSASEA